MLYALTVCVFSANTLRCCLKPEILFYDCVADSVGVGVEGHADAEQPAWVAAELRCVTLLIDLADRVGGGSAQLEFEQIDIVGSQHKHVDVAVGGLIFHLDVESDEPEQKIYYQLIVRLVTASMQVQIGRYGGDEIRQMRDDPFGVAVADAPENSIPVS